jgi:flagellar FliJ protein
MKKFKYSMESLLQIKLKLEDQAKNAYARARQRLLREEEKLKLLKDRRDAYEEELKALSMDRLDIVKIKKAKESIRIMEDKILNQMAAVRSAEQRLEVARIRLNNAMIERKTQERLKEKAWESYLLEYDAEERKAAEELTGYNYSSNTGKEDR